MIYRRTVSEEIETIRNAFAERAKAYGFGVLKEYRFKPMLQEKGFPIEHDITVFEICNPAAAQKVLDKYPEISVHLPCRIALYEKEGATVLSTVGFEEMLVDFGFEPEFREQMNAVYEKMMALIRSFPAA